MECGTVWYCTVLCGMASWSARQNARMPECGVRGAEIRETGSERTMSLRLAPAHSEFRIPYSSLLVTKDQSTRIG